MRVQRAVHYCRWTRKRWPRGVWNHCGLAACTLLAIDSPGTAPCMQSPPTFDVCIEMRSRHEWRVHADVAWAVDRLLMGKEAGELSWWQGRQRYKLCSQSARCSGRLQQEASDCRVRLTRMPPAVGCARCVCSVFVRSMQMLGKHLEATPASHHACLLTIASETLLETLASETLCLPTMLQARRCGSGTRKRGRCGPTQRAVQLTLRMAPR